MTVEHYIKVGFKLTGFLIKSDSVKKKYKVEMRWKETFDPNNKMGVYILADNKNNILKIGETQNMAHRFSCYESHSGPTNKMIRENMEMNDAITILFLECPSYNVGFGGVEVPSGINYRILEKNLLKQYQSRMQVLPKWNKGIQ